MKRYYPTRSAAKTALSKYERRLLTQPYKTDLKVRKVGTGSRSYLLVTDDELWMKRTHDLPLCPL